MKNAKLIFSIFFILSIFSNSTGQCIEESHSPFKNQGWRSCEKASSPNPERGENHWIMYDLGERLEIADLRIWNHNEWGETGMGAKAIMLDYSNDREQWNSIGPIDVDEAPGSWKYIAPPALELDNVSAQYILLTIMETWDNNSECAGISEIKMNLGNITSTDEELAELDIKLFPNPAVDHINVHLSDAIDEQLITITNSIGQTIAEIKPNVKSDYKIEIADLKDGLYNINIRSTTTNVTKSFVKMSY